MKWCLGLLWAVLLCISTSQVKASVGLTSSYYAIQQQPPPTTDSIIPFSPEPARSAFLSALIPGLGQIYNQQYWNLGFVYAIGAAAIIHFNNVNTRYSFFRDIYINKKDGLVSNDTPLSNSYSEEQLESVLDRWTSERDRAIALIVLAYLINVGDAFVGAHLFNFGDFDNLFSFNFDLNRDFSPMLALRFDF